MVQQRRGHGINEVMGTPSEVKQFNQKIITVVLLNMVRFSRVSFQHKACKWKQLRGEKTITFIHSSEKIFCDADKSMDPRLMLEIERVKESCNGVTSIMINRVCSEALLQFIVTQNKT